MDEGTPAIKWSI